jgi:predicted transcriptional regulator YdeE
MLLAGLRQRHDFSAAEVGTVAQWQRFLEMGALPGRVGEVLYGVICGADERGLEYMCAVEVESLTNVPDGIGKMRVPPQRYAVFAHDGDRGTLRSTWTHVFAWLAWGPYESAHKPDFERYGPETDPLSPLTGVEIWVGVVPR